MQNKLLHASLCELFKPIMNRIFYWFIVWNALRLCLSNHSTLRFLESNLIISRIPTCFKVYKFEFSLFICDLYSVKLTFTGGDLQWNPTRETRFYANSFFAKYKKQTLIEFHLPLIYVRAFSLVNKSSFIKAFLSLIIASRNVTSLIIDNFIWILWFFTLVLFRFNLFFAFTYYSPITLKLIWIIFESIN